MQSVIIKSVIVVLATLFFMTSCASKEQRALGRIKRMKHLDRDYDKEQEKLWSNNCSGYTFNYTDKFPNEKDSVTVYGKIRVCSTGKTPSSTTISFYNRDGSLEKKIKADRSGIYQVKLKAGYYDRIEAVSLGAEIFVPHVYLGLVGSSMNIDLKLLRIYVLY